MIGVPLNDRRCLGQITEVVNELVRVEDGLLAEIAKRHRTTESLAMWIRGLPQRDDLGEPEDGPKVDACEPVQRLRLPAPDPNCVERAALYVGVAELIDPRPVRQLATVDTPIEMHTFPIESGAPVVLDPRVPRNCLDCGVALLQRAPVAVEPRDAIEWTAQLAEAGAASRRNGPARLRKARNAIAALVDDGAAPARDEIDAIAWLLGLAEAAARRMGARALAIVKSTALAIADLADDAQALEERNASFGLRIGDLMLEAPPLSTLTSVAARVGLDLGAGFLRTQLGALGIDDLVIGTVEQELNREGMSLGPLARPRPMTLAAMATRRAA